MDLNKRDEHFEKNLKQYQSLKESFKKIFDGTLLNEKKVVTAGGKDLLKKVKEVTKLKEEDTEETKKDDVVDAEPKADEPKADDTAPAVDAPVVDAPAVDAPTTPAGDVPPAPVSTDAPEGGAVNSQDQLNTTEFAKTFLKGLPSDINPETSVDTNGIFKASVNDQHEGQFVVVAFPASKNIHQIADLLEPALPTPGAETPAAPAVPGTEVPPAAPAEGSPLDATATGEVPPAAAPAAEAPAAETPVEEPKADEDEEMKEEVKEDMVCENEDCMDDACATHGKKMMEEEEDEEAKLEKQRDPMMEGRKNWKAYQKVLVEKAQKAKAEKLLKEESAVAEKKELGDLEKAERRCEAIKKQLEAETDEEEKKALKADLEKAESAVNKLKTAGHNKKALDKVVDSIPRKDSDD